jgi:hypothetical protein
VIHDLIHITVPKKTPSQQALSAMSIMATPSSHYEVYKVKYNLTLQDPEETSTRHHTVIFIATDTNSSGGYIHEVVGDLVSGMTYRTQRGSQPETSPTFHAKEFLGLVARDRYPGEVDRVCMALPPPQARKRFNPETARYEAFNPDDGGGGGGSFYAPGECRPKYFKCTEWVEMRAVPALFQAGVLEG